MNFYRTQIEKLFFSIFFMSGMTWQVYAVAENVAIGARSMPSGNILDLDDPVSQILRSGIYGRFSEAGDKFDISRRGTAEISVGFNQEILCSDGEVLSANDLAASLRRCLAKSDPGVAVAVEGAEDLTRYAADPSVLVSGVSSPELLEDCTLFRRWFSERVGEQLGDSGLDLGCGSFRLVELVRGEKYVMEAYQVRESNVSRVTIRKLGANDDAVDQLRSGKVDILIDPTTDERERVLTDPTLVSLECPGYVLATRRILNVECAHGFNTGELEWRTGKSAAEAAG